MDRPRTPPTRRPRRRVATPFATVIALALLLAACAGLGTVTTTVEGVLRDAEGAAVAGAVVFVPEGAATSEQPTTQVATSQVTGCQTPSEAARATTCTDANGRFSLQVTTPLVGALRLVFERLYWRTEVIVDLGLRVPGEPFEVDAVFPALEADVELEAAVRYALPNVRDFDLILWNDEKAIVDLIAHTQNADADVQPLWLDAVPIRQPTGAVAFVSWTNYHHDLRAEGVSDCALDADTGAAVDCLEVEGPSLTFQGLPWLEPAQIEALMVDSEGNREALQNELLYQFSTLSVIGDEIDATYHGLELAAPYTPSSLQGLRSVLDLHYDAATTERLLSATPANYLLYNQIDLATTVEDGDVDLHAAALASSDVTIAPANHFLEDGIKFLRPVMVADATIYDAVASEWLVTNFRARVDAMANRQDLIFGLLQLDSTAAPANLTSLTSFSNTFTVRTRIGGYRRFTVQGQERFSWPANACVTSPSLLETYRGLSGDATGIDNEYWVWWTNTTRYAGTAGCAGIGGFGRAPNDGGNAWVSLRNASNQVTGSTLMHETGHLLDASHANGRNPHQCRLFGIFPVGPNGPSLMVTGVNRATRTECFAITTPTDTALRSRTRVAEHLHGLLQ